MTAVRQAQLIVSNHWGLSTACLLSEAPDWYRSWRRSTSMETEFSSRYLQQTCNSKHGLRRAAGFTMSLSFDKTSLSEYAQKKSDLSVSCTSLYPV